MKLRSLALIFLAGSLLTIPESRSEDLDIMNWKWAGNVQKSTEQVKEGNFSLRWDAGKESSMNFSVISPESDLTRFTRFHFWMYSEKATDTKVAIAVYPANYELGNHYIHPIVVDWEGWKEFDLSFSNFDKNRNPIGWYDIGKIEFLSQFYGQPDPGTILFINDLKLVE